MFDDFYSYAIERMEFERLEQARMQRNETRTLESNAKNLRLSDKKFKELINRFEYIKIRADKQEKRVYIFGCHKDKYSIVNVYSAYYLECEDIINHFELDKIPTNDLLERAEKPFYSNTINDSISAKTLNGTPIKAEVLYGVDEYESGKVLNVKHTMYKDINLSSNTAKKENQASKLTAFEDLISTLAVLTLYSENVEESSSTFCDGLLETAVYCNENYCWCKIQFDNKLLDIPEEINKANTNALFIMGNLISDKMKKSYEVISRNDIKFGNPEEMALECANRAYKSYYSKMNQNDNLDNNKDEIKKRLYEQFLSVMNLPKDKLAELIRKIFNNNDEINMKKELLNISGKYPHLNQYKRAQRVRIYDIKEDGIVFESKASMLGNVLIKLKDNELYKLIPENIYYITDTLQIGGVINADKSVNANIASILEFLEN